MISHETGDEGTKVKKRINKTADVEVSFPDIRNLNESEFGGGEKIKFRFSIFSFKYL